MEIQVFFDKDTSTLTYIVFDPTSKDAVIIDPVYDYDPASGKLSTDSVEKLVNFIKEKELSPLFSLETHAHADHLSGAQALKLYFPQIKIGISVNIKIVQETFKEVFHLKNLATDGSQFDLLWEDGQEMPIGTLKIKAIHTPGHTPACTSYLIEDAVFTGDSIFMPDFGTGRCDFPRGDAQAMYHSIKNKLYSLPDSTRIFVGHDYQPGGRELKYQSSVAEEKVENRHLTANTTEEEYVRFRTERDAGLNPPRLLLPSIQVNIDGGRLPQPEDNGMSYLKLPISR